MRQKFGIAMLFVSACRELNLKNTAVILCMAYLGRLCDCCFSKYKTCGCKWQGVWNWLFCTVKVNSGVLCNKKYNYCWEWRAGGAFP